MCGTPGVAAARHRVSTMHRMFPVIRAPNDSESGSQRDLNPEAANGRQLPELHALETGRSERRLGIDVGCLRPEEQVASDDRQAQLIAAHDAGKPRREAKGQPRFPKLREARVVYPALVNRQERMEVLLGRHVRRVGSMGIEVDAIYEEAGVRSKRGLAKHAGVVAPQIRRAEDLATNACIDEEAQLERAEAQRARNAASPSRLCITEHPCATERVRNREPRTKEEGVRGGVAKE